MEILPEKGGKVEKWRYVACIGPDFVGFGTDGNLIKLSFI